jgi:hypothetical protein
VADELTTTGESSLQRGLSSVWKRVAPLSVGAVASSAAIIAASAVLRRALGPKARLLGWAGTIVVLPLGTWLLTRRDERMGPDASGDAAKLPTHGETGELENLES